MKNGISDGAGRLGAAVAIAALAIVLALVSGRAPDPASAQESSEPPPRPKGEVTVRASAERFFVSEGEVVAEGPSTATYRGEDGSTYSLDQRLRLQVDTTNNCRVLELHLAELYLDLLGLQVRTSTINAKLTGDRKQALGKLFCRLSDALKFDRDALAKRTARSLNRNLGDRGLPVLQFTATVHGQESPGARSARQGQAPPPPPDACPVLDLLLGPLDLDLLGLVLELYGPTEGDPIRVNVVADPNGGELGRTFCGLSGQ